MFDFNYVFPQKQAEAFLDGMVRQTKAYTKMIEVEQVRTSLDAMVDANVKFAKDLMPIFASYSEATRKLWSVK